jgi:hypothetical protein
MIPTSIRLNGKVFTRNSVSIRVNGVIRITGVESVEWSDETPFELVSGMNDGGVPLGKAQGNYGCTASISVYADEAAKFEAAVLAGSPLAGLNLSAATFQLPIIMREDVRTRSILLVNCNIAGRPSRTVGADGTALVSQYALQPTLVLEDGKALVNLIPAL